MATSFSNLRFSHPRLLLLPLLMLSQQLYSVLSDAPPPQHSCNKDFEIRWPFDYVDGRLGCGTKVISCDQGITRISLFNQSFSVRHISYPERKIDIDHNPASSFYEQFCNRDLRQFELEREKFFPRGFNFLTPSIVIWKCDHALEDRGKLEEVPCGNHSPLYRGVPSDHEPSHPHSITCSRYEIPDSCMPDDKDHCDITSQTFSLHWDFGCDPGGGNLPDSHCEDGSMKPSNCEGGQSDIAGPSRKAKKLIIGSLAAAFGSLVLGCVLFFFTRPLWVSSSTRGHAGCFQLHTPTKVEKFLIDCEVTLTATRYTYNDISKMTKKFNCKLGQGGYASVYRGQLVNGTPVAVKLMEKSYNDGEEFCNEVATIGRIHRVNVVRLLGFCVEGTCRALVYEFMANGSLEKLKNTIAGRCLCKDIALGVARGIEYLHQGCDRRIIHFDIKPHNILLDHDFTPKISDFGLAKSYGRERSIVTITEGKGTIGYIAPELIYGDVKHASHKSDVYSYGMLLLSMVGMKEKDGPTDGSSSEAYFPQWIYETLSRNQNLDGIREGEDEMIRKMATIALWCVQWNPNDRPCMKEVVKMLEGSTSNLKMPPNHFYAGTEHDYMIRGIVSSSMSE